MIALYRNEVEKLNRAQIGQHQLVLVEGVSNLILYYKYYILQKNNIKNKNFIVICFIGRRVRDLIKSYKVETTVM